MRYKDPELMDKIVEFVDRRYFEDGTYPTIREIASELSVSKSCIGRYVVEMQEKGIIERNGKAHCIKTSSINKVDDLMYIPVVGTVACGKPLFAEENIETYLPIPTSFLGKGKYFILRAKGDSMINAGINPNDYIIVKKQDYAEIGQIVVALIDDEATLKRYYLDSQKNQVRLHAENEKYEDMYFNNIIIQGIAVKIIKDLV